MCSFLRCRAILAANYFNFLRYSTGLRFQSSKQSIIYRIFPPIAYPYLELARIHKPIGTWLVYLPCTWMIAIATPVGSLPDIEMLALFCCGSFLMRGAGCTINDILDCEYDAQVSRTRLRPLVMKQISVLNSLIFLGFQLSGALFILLNLNMHSIMIGAAVVPLVFAYPLFKRFTYWPQVMLGITLNWGVILASTAINYFSLAICMPLYILGICQTIIYDSIYSHQDINDDINAGIKSTAILFGNNTKKTLSLVSFFMPVCLGIAGINSDASLIYYAGTALTMIRLWNGLQRTNLKDPGSCSDYFKLNRDFGLMIFASIALDKLLRSSAFCAL